jgi:hypothetical protein
MKAKDAIAAADEYGYIEVETRSGARYSVNIEQIDDDDDGGYLLGERLNPVVGSRFKLRGLGSRSSKTFDHFKLKNVRLARREIE